MGEKSFPQNYLNLNFRHFRGSTLNTSIGKQKISADIQNVKLYINRDWDLLNGATESGPKTAGNHLFAGVSHSW